MQGTLNVGQFASLRGDITSLVAIAARDPNDVEKMLGFHFDRLRQGYWICLLVEPVTAMDFRLAGTTLRSGGREGLPAASQRVDSLRVHVEDRVNAEYGAIGSNRLKTIAATSINRLIGGERTAKVVPVAPHARYASPAMQYPPGGGAPQWTLLRDKMFLVAARVEDDLTVRTPSFTAKIGPGSSIDERMKLARYLAQAN